MSFRGAGHTEQANKRVAEKILAVRRAEVAEGRYMPVKRFDRVRFEELADIWWEEHGKDTHSCFGFVLPRIKEHFGGVKASAITQSHIKDFMEELAEKYSPDYVNSHRTVLNGIFNYAVQARRFDFNPVRLVPQMHTQGRERLITREEFNKLLGKCKGNPELYCYVMLGGTTTMRSGEILQRRWNEVHLGGEHPYVEIPRTKNNDPKVIPLPRVAIEALRKLPTFGTHQYVFPRALITAFLTRRSSRNGISGTSGKNSRKLPGRPDLKTSISMTSAMWGLRSLWRQAPPTRWYLLSPATGAGTVDDNPPAGGIKNGNKQPAR